MSQRVETPLRRLTRSPQNRYLSRRGEGLLGYWTILFVRAKVEKQWIWLTMDAKSRQIIGFRVGDRCRKSAQALWTKIPKAYRRQATFYTDQYVVYVGGILTAQHLTVSRLARKTNHIEQFNNTLRQRVSRLVRSALSFSKTLANHIGAIQYCMCHCHLTRATA